MPNLYPIPRCSDDEETVNVPQPGCICTTCPSGPPQQSVLVKPGSSSRPPIRKKEQKPEEDFDFGPDDDDEDLRPCNIILRNKKAVAIMSRTLKQARLIEEANMNRLNAWPRMKRKCKKKKKPEVKKSSLLNLLDDEKDCTCELIARATKANVHTRLSLAEFRDTINGSPIPSIEAKEDNDENKEAEPQEKVNI